MVLNAKVAKLRIAMCSRRNFAHFAFKKSKCCCPVPAVKRAVANSGASADCLAGRDYSRQAAGTLKSLLVYNRELTDDEIAHNAAIDAIRFANAHIPCGGFAISIR